MTVTAVGADFSDSVNNATARACAVAWHGSMGQPQGVEIVLEMHRNTKEASETLLGLAGIIARMTGDVFPVIQIDYGPHMNTRPVDEAKEDYKKASDLLSTMSQYLKGEDIEGALVAFNQATAHLDTNSKQEFLRSCFHAAGITIQQLTIQMRYGED